jgi:hypothetical protein
LAPSDLNWFRWPSDNPPVRPIIKIKNTHKTQPKKSPLCPTHGDDAPTEKSKRAVARPAATVLPKKLAVVPLYDTRRQTTGIVRAGLSRLWVRACVGSDISFPF